MTGAYDDVMHKRYPIGTYFDSAASMWYRNIYVLDCDLIRIQMISLYQLDIYNMDKEQFLNWCNANHMENTKKYFGLFKRIAPKQVNSNRSLLSAGRKRGIHFVVSDCFIFKGNGPYRAIVAYGKSRSSVESASNEYEMKLCKTMKTPSLLKDWDNYIFPSYEFSFLSHLGKSGGEDWRKRHSHEVDSQCPYSMERKLSIIEQDFTYNFKANK